jgi:hypothetical protein
MSSNIVTDIEQLAIDISEKLGGATEIKALVTFLNFILHGMNLAAVQATPLNVSPAQSQTQAAAPKTKPAKATAYKPVEDYEDVF